MGSLKRRLGRLEALRGRSRGAGSLTSVALRALSDEDLQTLAEILEGEQGYGGASFEDLYAAVGEQGRRALDAYYEAYEAVRRGEESRSPPERDYAELLRRAEAGDEEAKREVDRLDGYRIWKYGK